MILVGNTFPLGLVKRRVVITPKTPNILRERFAQVKAVCSYWGHAQTLAQASELCGINLTPVRERPALIVGPNDLPSLDNQEFSECWIIVPEYVSGYRPAPGEVVTSSQIVGWQVLELLWRD